MYFYSRFLYFFKKINFSKSQRNMRPYKNHGNLKCLNRCQLNFYDIYSISEIWGKSEKVSMYVCTMYVRPGFPQNMICFPNQRTVSPRKQDVLTADAVYKFKIHNKILEIWGKIGKGQSVRRPFWIFPPNRKYFWKSKNCAT